MNGRLELRIITKPYSEVYWRYFGRLVFGNSLTKHTKIISFLYSVVIFFHPLSHIPPCYQANPPNFPRLIGPRVYVPVQVQLQYYWVNIHVVVNEWCPASSASQVISTGNPKLQLIMGTIGYCFMEPNKPKYISSMIWNGSIMVEHLHQYRNADRYGSNEKSNQSS